MAELPKNIRKPGGDLVAARSPFTRRMLLPTEADLCNVLGLTEEEYFQFLEGVAAKVKERPEAYGLVPDIRCDPVTGLALWQTVGGVTTLTWLGQVAVGVALSFGSYLLTPKPPSQKQGTQQRTADIGGTKRFAPHFSFNSIQDLANLGDLIPLVFSNRGSDVDNGENPNGGVRVNSQLLWSQMVSLGSYQQLKILALFSLGDVEKMPDFKGYAIGDLLIGNYHSDKIFTVTYPESYFSGEQPPHDQGLAYYTNSIPFQRNGDPFPNNTNVFKVDDKEYFCGTRNPTTQATFGLSNPMPNATAYRLPYELVRTPSDMDTDSGRPGYRITLKKRRKLLGYWPMRAGFYQGGQNELQQTGKELLSVGEELSYQILGSEDVDKNGIPIPYSGQYGYQLDNSNEYFTMEPHGLTDVNAATTTIREATDSYLAVGEQYMAGTALVSCTSIKNEDGTIPAEPWNGKQNREFKFKVVEKGLFERVGIRDAQGNLRGASGDLNLHVMNPNWDVSGNFFCVKPGGNDKGRYYYEQIPKDLLNSNTTYVLQKVSLGTISNNRRCHITEIGIKSKVFKQIQTANVNSKPTEKEIHDIYDKKSTLQLGNINKYVTRYSFFKLQVRQLGEEDWVTLAPGKEHHLGVFAVRGCTPEEQFNYIRIVQPAFDQYEYRFLPVPGAFVVKKVLERPGSATFSDLSVCLLNANGSRTAGSIESFESSTGNYVVKFAGELFHAVNTDKLSNPEWNLGHATTILKGSSGTKINSLSKYYAGSRDDYTISNFPFARQNHFIYENVFYYPGYGGYPEGSDDAHTLIMKFEGHPRPGVNTWSLYINKYHHAPKNTEYNKPNLLNNRYWGSIEREDGDLRPVEFHYTLVDANGKAYAGGKLIPGNQVSTPNSGRYDGSTRRWYFSVTREEQLPINRAPSFGPQEVSLATDPGDPGAGAKARVTVYSDDGSGSNQKWFAEWDLSNTGNGAYENGQPVELSGSTLGISEDIRLTVNVDAVGQREYGDEIEKNLNIYDAASDFWTFEGDQSSHLDGPEHQITYCNEIIETEGDRSVGEPATYEDLAYAGLRVDSSKEWTNFSQFSAYFKKGIKVESLLGGSDRATCLFPEIAYALLTDTKIGAGKIISKSAVDRSNMEIAAKFCRANGFFWDGMISDRVNLREFIYDQALYCLLDFTIIGGKFSLYPTVPFDPNTFKIDSDGPHSKPKIKAMFTDGNIKDLEVSFLSSEDRQTFKANVLYRKEKENGFPEIKSDIVRLFGTQYNDDPIETYDLSGFCTSASAAHTFAMYMLALRKHLDHTVSFKTAPNYIVGVRPGDYIKVFSTTQHVNRFNNGAILDDGTVVSQDPITGSKNIYYWKPSKVINNEMMPVDEANVDFSNTSAVKAFAGSLFTIKETGVSDQCYKVESITYGEEGMVDVVGSYAQLTDDGKLEMLQNWESSTNPLFMIEE